MKFHYPQKVPMKFLESPWDFEKLNTQVTAELDIYTRDILKLSMIIFKKVPMRSLKKCHLNILMS